jgi:phosphatidylinositol glycan class B
MIKISRSIKVETVALFLLVIGHTLAAYTSFGFHHPDEHFQILEWTNYFLGRVPDASHLAWEHSAQIRPWFQPMLHAIFVKAFIGLDIYNPFDIAFFFRLVYGYLNLFSIIALWRYFREKYSLSSHWLLWISLLWFFPYIHVRTSSENLAGILLSFALLEMLKNRSFMAAGFLFGFSFLARYQVALGLFGMGLALLYRDRKVTKEHLKLLVGFVIPVILGLIIDRIGYGNWVFTAYRYFKVNLVDGVAATFNPYPWYQYFIWILQLIPVISLPLFFGAVSFMKKADRDDRYVIGSFVWSFFVLHCFITNKEYRFLFPLMNVVPFMAIVGIRSFEPRLLKKAWLIPYAVISVVAFMISSLHGASLNMLGTVTLVDRHSKPDTVWLSNRNYTDLGPNERYYSSSVIKPAIFTNASELETLLSKNKTVHVAIDGKMDDAVTTDLLAAAERAGCKLIDSNIPRYFYQFRSRFAFLGRLPYVAIYECHEN